MARLSVGLFGLIILVMAILIALTIGILTLANGTEEMPSPYARIEPSNIKIEKDRIIIHIENARLVHYADTNSMDPSLDTEAKGIEIVPKSEDDIHVGDIVTFRIGGQYVAHRVVKIGEDEEGKYFITKGDNNSQEDEKIRFSQIKYVTVAVLW